VKTVLVAGLLLALGGAGAVAQDAAANAVPAPNTSATQSTFQPMKPPRLAYAEVDWRAAAATLGDDNLGSIQPMRTRNAVRMTYPALGRLNNIMSAYFPALATSPVPVLLPFDVTARLRDQANSTLSGDETRYFSGFHAARFFYPGPAGYDAAFAIRTSEIPELSEVKFPEPIEVIISGSSLLYELDTPREAAGTPVPALEEEFPGIRKMLLESHLRYTFVRYGVPYSVSIGCFETASTRYKMPSCRTADQIAQRFLRALQVVGGMPHPPRSAEPWPVERPAKVSHAFGYFAPGQIKSGTGFRDKGGRPDYTVYSQIRFPLAEAPAFAGTELFHRGARARITDPNDAAAVQAATVPWRDNFCERRGFSVSQCPVGIGHQGQDVRPLICHPASNSDRCDPPGDVVAARGGMILRSPRQEAAYLFVNAANEHIRFRYLHMSPRKMDADNLLSGRRVAEGEVIGEVGNYSMREAGTSYHLHFDIQVPTRDGWVFVSPYMTLVAAYERLIGERGTELADTPAVPDGDPPSTGSVNNIQSSRTETVHRKTPQWAKNRGKTRSQRQRYAGR
jgi:murein DD-endopeptidase MepM/ murein hydrolase activator NlpD